MYLGYVTSESEGNAGNTNLEGKGEGGGRLRGRQARHWLDHVKERTGLSSNKTWRKPDDRVAWRKPVSRAVHNIMGW